jgi:4-aminobutyrate aminotransferase-like enzyme
MGAQGTICEEGRGLSMQSTKSGLNVDIIKQDEVEHVLYPWVVQKGLSPLVVDHAAGKYFYDSSGKQYLDFSSQFVFSNLGHADERMADAISRQARTL